MRSALNLKAKVLQMRNVLLFSSVLFLFLTACHRSPEHKIANLFSPKVTEARGYVVPKDSMAKPTVVPAGKPIIKKAVKTDMVLTNTNVIPAGAPKVVVAGTPEIYTPGQDGYPLPKTTPVTDSSVVAVIPRISQVKDNYFQDNFPQPGSSFIKLRGMNLVIINCIMKDNSGNIWVGTEAGVSRMDGRFRSHFSRRDGLAGSFVAGIIQDKKGNMWFGTAGGLSRYDGKQLTNFTEETGLPSNYIQCLLEDKSGNIWFAGVYGNITRYDGKTFTLFNAAQGLGNGMFMAIVQDKNGNLWFGSSTGLYCYDGKKFSHFTTKEGLINNGIQRMLVDRKGNIWLGNDAGITCYDGKTFSCFAGKEALVGGIWDMTEDDSGNLWLATKAGGLCRFDGKSFTRYTNQRDLVDAEANALFNDKSGNIWVGGGRTDVLMRYNDNCFSHYTVRDGLSDYEIWSMLKDKNGNMWFGTNFGGVDLYDGKSMTHFSNKEGFVNHPVVDIIQDKTGTIWFATSGAGVISYDGNSFRHFGKNQGLPDRFLESIVEDRSGNIWLGTQGAGLCRFDGKSFTNYTKNEGLSDNTILSAFIDNNGILWFGSRYGGVMRYDGKSFTHFTEKEGFCNKPVYSIYQDKSNYLWFCTVGAGAVRYDGKSFLFITEQQGLKYNTVNGMLQDKSGNFCFACGNGLSILSAGNLEKLIKGGGYRPENQPVLFRNFNPEDGFSGWGCNGPICEDDQGTIWISSSDRLTAYYPTKDVTDTTAPSMQLTGIQVYHEIIPWIKLEKRKDTSFVLGNGVRFSNFKFDSLAMWYAYPLNLSLAYQNNYITFNYNGITPKLNTLVQYRYKLDGLDEDWSALTTRAEAPYGNIPHGTYTFKVKAMNSEGYWSKEFNYTFTIRPPWWKTWWAYAGYILVILAGFWAAIRTTLENQRKKIRLIVNERNRIARELHDDIGAELNRITIVSQLLHNAPNSNKDQQEKLRYISEAGKKVLGSIGEIIWTMNPQKDNLDSLLAYIRRFVTEYLETNEIDVNIEFPDEIPANAVSDEYRRNLFLVVKEATANISKYSKATTVRLSMNIRDRLADFEISDNGIGFSVKEKQNWGNGLRNMNQRMKDIGGDFEISSGQNQGTLIRLTFPVR